MVPTVKTCMVRVRVFTLWSAWSFLALAAAGQVAAVGTADDDVLPNTRPLTMEGDIPAYINYGALLADRGFIVFAPQNLYLFRDRFRTLQRKANPLGKTLFSVIVPQHRHLRWPKPQSEPQ